MKYLILVVSLLAGQYTFALSGEFKNYLDISGEFESLMKNEEAHGRLPRIEVKTASLIAKKLATSQSVIISKKYTVDDFGNLLDVCGKANKFGMTYLLHNMSLVVKKTDSPQVIQVKVAKLMKENSIKYQNELKLFYPFLVDCLAIQSALVEPFWKSLPLDQKTQARLNGVIQMRNGVLQIYAGVLTSLGDSSVDASFKDSLLVSASNAAPVMASLLPLDNREIILKMLVQYKKTASKKYLKYFAQISKAFSSKKCNEICQL